MVNADKTLENPHVGVFNFTYRFRIISRTVAE